MFTIWMVLNTVIASLKSEEGQGLAEYALIIVLVAVAVLATLGSVGSTISGVFENITTGLSAAGG